MSLLSSGLWLISRAKQTISIRAIEMYRQFFFFFLQINVRRILSMTFIPSIHDEIRFLRSKKKNKNRKQRGIDSRTRNRTRTALFKSRSWRHFYCPRSKIVISNTPNSNITKDYISNKCCSFKMYIHQRILKKINASPFPQKYEAAQLFSTLIIIRKIICKNLTKLLNSGVHI